jgi:hypothetical protein
MYGVTLGDLGPLPATVIVSRDSCRQHLGEVPRSTARPTPTPSTSARTLEMMDVDETAASAQPQPRARPGPRFGEDVDPDLHLDNDPDEALEIERIAAEANTSEGMGPPPPAESEDLGDPTGLRAGARADVRSAPAPKKRGRRGGDPWDASKGVHTCSCKAAGLIVSRPCTLCASAIRRPPCLRQSGRVGCL